MQSKYISNIKNSYEFLRKLKSLTMADNYVLISFDVTTLYTNIPLESVAEAIVKRHDELKHELSYTVIIKAIGTIMNNTMGLHGPEYVLILS